MRNAVPTILVLLTLPHVLTSQTTQGIVYGQVLDSVEGSAVAGARVECLATSDYPASSAAADASGFYHLVSISPGRYRLRVSADGYQAQELHQLDVPVAGFLQVDFRLRPLSDVWEQGFYRSVLPQGSRAVLTFAGPDIDPGRTTSVAMARPETGGLEVAVSEVVSSVQLRDLPLTGRDAYTLLITAPSVAADAATARGLGVSVSGQRPSASRFLLDGIENNSHLTSGPLTQLPPEALQEYRLSLGSYSAEFGRSSGYLANAVTRSAGRQWHGLGYFYLRNESFDANGFQQNRLGVPRLPAREHQPGVSAGGPLSRNGLFLAVSIEGLRRRLRSEPVTVELPTTAYPLYTAPGSQARQLLDRFGSSLPVSARDLTANVTLSPPSSEDRWLSLVRLDQHLSVGRRLMARAIVADSERPDFLWTPYPDFVSALTQRNIGFAGAFLGELAGGITAELRAGFQRDRLGWDRPHPEIPTLTVDTARHSRNQTVTAFPIS